MFPVARSLFNTGVLCYYQGKYKQSEELHMGALRNLEKAYGQNNPKVIVSLHFTFHKLTRMFVGGSMFG